MGAMTWLAGVTGAASLPRLASVCAIVAAVAFGGGAYTGARLASSRYEAANAKATRQEQRTENEKQGEVHKVTQRRAAERRVDRDRETANAQTVDEYLRKDGDSGRAVLDADGVRIWNCLARGETCGGRPEPATGVPGEPAGTPGPGPGH